MKHLSFFTLTTLSALIGLALINQPVKLKSDNPKLNSSRVVVSYKNPIKPQNTNSNSIKNIPKILDLKLTNSLAIKPLEQLNFQNTVVQAQWLREHITGAQIYTLSQEYDVDTLKNALDQLKAQDPSIEYVQVDYKVYPSVIEQTTTTPQANQWTGFVNSVNLTQAWNISSGNPNLKIAVVDTGTTNYPNTREVGGANFLSTFPGGRSLDPRDTGNFTTSADGCGVADSTWHGTSTEGVIVTTPSAADQATQHPAVLPNGQAVPIRALWKCGGFLSDAIEGALWAAGETQFPLQNNPNTVRIVNFSLGATSACQNLEFNAFQRLAQLNVIPVASAGNGASLSVQSPGNCSNAIAVGASDINGNIASYSNYGPGVTVLAPGGDSNGAMFLPSNTGTQGPVAPTIKAKNGTSFAAPYVAGILGLLTSLRNDVTVYGAQAALENTATYFTCNTDPCLPPRTNALALLQAAQNPTWSARPQATFTPNNKALNLKFANFTPTTSSLANPTINGTSAGNFSINFNNCTNVAAGSGCTIQVQYSGNTNLNSHSLTLTDTANNPISVPLNAVLFAGGATGSNPNNPTTPNPVVTPPTPLPPNTNIPGNSGGGGGGSIGIFGLLGLAFLMRALKRANI